MPEMISMEKSLALLKKYSIPHASWKIAKSPESAAKAAKQLGFPVALKALSKKIVHKTDSGAVSLNLADEDEVKSAFDDIMKSMKKLRIKPDGMLVQKMEAGTEVIIGLKRDPQFGPVVMFGLGGIFVEILKDVSLRIAPLTKDDCIGMIEEVKGYEILKGARGKKPVNTDALVKILMSVSKIGEKNKKITELDLNPIIADEKSAKVVDIRVMSEK